MAIGKIARRTFLVGAAAIAGGVAVATDYVSKPYPNPLENDLANGETTFNPYVKITSDNRITVIAPRAEMGQGIRTTLAALVAEELDVPLEMVDVEHGPAGWIYYNSAPLEDGGPFPFFDEGMMAQAMRSVAGPIGKLLGIQMTGGSSSTRDGYEKMRHAGAAARAMLVSAAAGRWGVKPESSTTASGKVTDPASGRTATYGDLAADAAGQEPPSVLKLKDKADWKLLGKPQKRVDLLAKVTGTAQFGIDVICQRCSLRRSG